MFYKTSLSAVFAAFLATTALSPPAASQITTWPNSLSMWFDQDEPGYEMAHLRVGPVAPHADLAFLALPESVADVSSLGQIIADGATLVHVDQADANGWFTVPFSRTALPRDLECAVFSYANEDVDFAGAFIGNARIPFAPPPPGLGRPNIRVLPGRTVILNGAGSADDEIYFTNRPLVEAIRRASPNDVIGVYGDVTIGTGEAMWLGGAQDPFKTHHVHWGDVPMRFAVIGMTPNAKITGFAVSKDVSSSNEETAGIGDVIFANLTIENSRHALSAISGNPGKTFGRLRFYGCRFQAHPEALAQGELEGYGAKWWIRVPTRGSWDVRQCSFAPVQEHCIYLDSPRGDNYFVGIEHNGSWRTAIQIVNRAWELQPPPPGSTPEEAEAWYEDLLAQFENGTRPYKPSGEGSLLFENITLRDLWGEGGSGITVAGFLGDIHLRNITAHDPDPFHGVFTAWTDAGIHHGTHLFTGADGGLYSTKSVTVTGIDIDLPQADRDPIAISGVEQVHFYDFDVSASGNAIRLDSPFGVPDMRGQTAVVDGQVVRLPGNREVLITNGNVELYVPRPVSQFTGFQSFGKIKMWDHALTNSEIDARWP